MNRNILLLSFSRITQILYLFLSFKLLTIFLSKEDVGFYFLLLSIFSYLSLIIVNPVGIYINRFLHKWKNESVLKERFCVYILFLLGLSFIAVPILYGLFSFFDIKNSSPLMFVLTLSLYLFAYSLNNTIVPSLNLLDLRVSFVVLTFLTQACSLGFSYTLISFMDSTAILWLLGQALGFLLVAIISVIYLFNRFQYDFSSQNMVKNYSKKNTSLLLRFCGPIALTNVFLWTLTQYYRPFSEKALGLEYLSLIGLGFGIAASISGSLEYLFQQLEFPQFFKKINEGTKADREKCWNRLANTALPIYISLPIFVSFLAPFIVSVMSTHKFENAAFFLSIGIWVELFRMISNIFNLIPMTELNTKKSILPFMGGSLITIGGSFLALNFGEPEFLLPFTFLVGSFFALLFITLSLKKMFCYQIKTANILLAILLASPYLVSPLLYKYKQNMHLTVAILCGFSLYYLITQYFLYSRSRNYCD